MNAVIDTTVILTVIDPDSDTHTAIETDHNADTVIESVSDDTVITAATSGGQPLSLGEFRQALWRDPAVRVYAVLQASRVPGALGRVAAARQVGEVLECECLTRGALDDDHAARAAYLLALAPQGGFTDWLLVEAAPAMSDWGVLLRSPLAPMAMRTWARARMQAALPDGRVMALNWLDPGVLRELLPLADPGQEAALLDGLDSLSWNEGSVWIHHRMAQGHRLTDRHEVTR
ncbi:DUF4123 domain-containing protein [Aquabacterium sp. A7-Y]|uniref:DUF4123 domain-containing protein n=1 Tax=Aquabacterium sp. A7-Y TaxID=1349605 RepID=UPI00223D2DA4|nr:DUF4123 domain-containing protein [Aquabacterium sp. A7-Y]MCW7539695.1 DUF4123 domain-containing protein [Aquabacterium sp. A7-Y]